MAVTVAPGVEFLRCTVRAGPLEMSTGLSGGGQTVASEVGRSVEEHRVSSGLNGPVTFILAPCDC